MTEQAKTENTSLTVHRGDDYAAILRPDDTTDTALVIVRKPSKATMALLHQMAAGPDLLPIAENFAATLEYYAKKHDREGDDEGARLARLNLNAVVLPAIAKAKGLEIYGSQDGKPSLRPAGLGAVLSDALAKARA